MTGKTHLASGMAVTLLVTQPATISESIMCLGVASIGSVISDIDVSTSKSRKNFNKVIAIITVSFLFIFLAEMIFHVGILKTLSNNSNFMRVAVGFMAMISICLFGKGCPHRSFMHSALGLFLMTVSAYIILPQTALFMGISIVSHILLDLFNKKRIQILYPLKKPKISLNLCKAGGWADHLIFAAATFVLTAEIILKIISFIKK